MAICVNSEIGQLKKVLLHRPGKELEHLVPQELERLLFDDIPYLALAQKEHDTFAAVLRENGAEVVYLEDLMAETLRRNPELREIFIRQFISEAGPVAQSHAAELMPVLMEIEDARELVQKTMCGVTAEELTEWLYECPEGIVLYCGWLPHAVFLTDCTDGVFWCVDPAYGTRMTLADSYLGSYGDQEAILRNVTACWYIANAEY